MRTRTRLFVAALAACAAAAATGATLAQDPGVEAFDSPAVREIAARAETLSTDDLIALLKRTQRLLDRRLLEPTEADWKSFEDLRGRSDAGLARVVERGLGNGIVTPREGGAYWSFTRLSNSYDHQPQIGLEQWKFATGFYGGNTGSVVPLPVDDLRKADESAVPEDLRAAAEAVYESSRKSPRERPAAEVGTVYAVRAVMWDECDVLAAFQVVSKDAYGVTIAWRILRTYEVPKRKR